ncbi:MAG: transglycosylase SLT domain-containing protein, partial [Acidobacteriota bacterium]
MTRSSGSPATGPSSVAGTGQSAPASRQPVAGRGNVAGASGDGRDRPRMDAAPGAAAGRTPDPGEAPARTPDGLDADSPGDDVERLLEQVDQIYLQGVDALQAGREDEARGLFDRAVELFLHDPQQLWDDARLAAEFEDLIGSVHRITAAMPDERTDQDVLDEDLKEITAYLTPEQAEEEKAKVAERTQTVVFDLPVELTDRVVAFIDAFSGPRRKQFEPGMVRSGGYLPMIRRIFREEGIPQDLAYMAHIESAFKTHAYSRARARGIFQFISSTGRRYGLRSDWWVDMRADPELAAHAAARYLKVLHDVYDDWYLALAEYNGGSRVRSAWKRSGRKADFWRLARGRSLRTETRNYVPQILAAIVLHKSPEKYGLTTRRDPPVVYDTVPLPSSIDLRVAARLAGTTLEEMVGLNPGLRRLATPPDYESFPLRVPPGSGESFLTQFARLPEAERLPWYRHRVRRGETLSTIAAR